VDRQELLRTITTAKSFERLLAAITPLTDGDLFGADRWPWLGQCEALMETLLWDISRHYEAHLEHLAPLARTHVTIESLCPLGLRRRDFGEPDNLSGSACAILALRAGELVGFNPHPPEWQLIVKLALGWSTSLF
jgi:hypothetical protein